MTIDVDTDRPLQHAGQVHPQLERLLAPIIDRVTHAAAEVDAGVRDLRPALADLGAAGLLGLGLPPNSGPRNDSQGSQIDGTLLDQATVVRALARVCTATAFSVWAHRTAVGYVATWGSPALRASVLPELLEGRRPAATAMASAFQAALGLRDLTVTADPIEGNLANGVTLRGVVPWASNLYDDGTLVVLAAQTIDGRNVIVAVTTDQPGITLKPYPELLALSSTGSTTMLLDGVHVPPSHVLTDRFLDFLADVRPMFLLLQSALCFGLADAALAATADRLGGPASVLHEDFAELTATHARLDATFVDRLLHPGHADADLVRLRLEASQLAVDATRLESSATGGAGYLADSATARRLREAAFLPIQSPTEVQLRWELSHSA